VFFDAIFRSIGRLLFFPNSAFGIWILALVTVFSPRRGFFLFAGTLIATGLACQLTRGSFAWEYGFFSYSAGLVGLGLASLPEKINWKTIFLVCVLSCFLTIAVDRLFRAANLPVLSLPYVLSMWVALLSRIPRVNMSWSHSKAPPIRVARLAQELEEVA
jgi:urea transporter